LDVANIIGGTMGAREKKRRKKTRKRQVAETAREALRWIYQMDEKLKKELNEMK